jgi:hypothetical protein
MPEFFRVLSVGVVLLSWSVWLCLFIQSHRLFYRFRAKYPELAKKDIPYAFEYVQHPEKFLYFFRAKSEAVLRQDHALWKLRNQVRVLLILSGVIPVGGVIAVVLTAVQFHR